MTTMEDATVNDDGLNESLAESPMTLMEDGNDSNYDISYVTEDDDDGSSKEHRPTEESALEQMERQHKRSLSPNSRHTSRSRLFENSDINSHSVADLRQRNPNELKEYAVSSRWRRRTTERKEMLKRTGKGKGPNGDKEPYCQPCTCSIEDFHNYCCCMATRRFGGMFFLCERRDGSPIMVAGPCWPFCTFITVPVIIFVAAMVSYFIIFGYYDQRIGAMPWWVSFIYFPLVFLTLASLFFVSCRDPGLVEKIPDEEAGRMGWYWNEQTSSFRPPGAMYCRECKVLIQDFDHLCPWTGTGIGVGNMCAFKLFVVAINMLCYFSIGLIAFGVIRSLNQ